MTKKSKIDHYTDKEALDFHNRGKSGKIEIISSKSLTTKRDLSLAYSPGVAVPVKEISKNQWEMDLAGIAADQLTSLGVQVFGGGFCTFCDEKNFFSYRRDGVTGRMGAFIWID